MCQFFPVGYFGDKHNKFILKFLWMNRQQKDKHKRYFEKSEQ